jgi:hypothetical protein
MADLLSRQKFADSFAQPYFFFIQSSGRGRHDTKWTIVTLGSF